MTDDDVKVLEKLERYVAAKKEEHIIPPNESKLEKAKRLLLEFYPDRIELANWIYRAAYKLIVPYPWYLIWRGSGIRETGDFYIYNLIDRDLRPGQISFNPKHIFCGFIEKSGEGKEEFQREMDKKIRMLTERIANRKDIHDEIITLVKIIEDLKDLIDNMRKSLEKYMRLRIFPGDCEYLS